MDWINVNDRMPGRSEPVIGCIATPWGIPTVSAMFYAGTWRWMDMQTISMTVTHWMPLPPPPPDAPSFSVRPRHAVAD